MSDRRDDEALSSLTILAEATEMVFEQGHMELIALRNLLDRAVRTGADDAVREAREMYAGLEPKTRTLIEEHALTLAAVRRRANRG